MKLSTIFLLLLPILFVVIQLLKLRFGPSEVDYLSMKQYRSVLHNLKSNPKYSQIVEYDTFNKRRNTFVDYDDNAVNALTLLRYLVVTAHLNIEICVQDKKCKIYQSNDSVQGTTENESEFSSNSQDSLQVGVCLVRYLTHTSYNNEITESYDLQEVDTPVLDEWSRRNCHRFNTSITQDLAQELELVMRDLSLPYFIPPRSLWELIKVSIARHLSLRKHY